MDIKKGLLAGLMVTTISMTALTSVYAKAPVQHKGEPKIAICTTDECTIDSNFDFNFKEFSKQFKENVSQEDYKKAENLFNKAIKLEDDASEYWDELYKLDLFDTSVLLGNVEPMSFEEFSKMFKKDITTETKNKAKEIYNNIIKLEKEGKFDETMELWKELDSLELYDETNNIVMGTSTMENMSFEEFAKSFKKDVIEDDKKKAKELYEKAVQLDKDKKYDEAVKVWSQLFEMNLFDETGAIKHIEIGEAVADVITFEGDVNLDKVDAMQELTFEEFSKGFKKDLKPEVIEKAKELFEKATAKEKEAQKVWDEIYKMDIFEVSTKELSTMESSIEKEI